MQGRLLRMLVALLIPLPLLAHGALWGTDFVVSFGSIVGNVQSDSLYLFLLPSNATTCSIAYVACADGIEYTTTVRLSDPRNSVRVAIPRVHLAQPYGLSPCATIRLHSDEPILVAAMASDSLGGEATAVLPNVVLNRTYIVPTQLPLSAGVAQDSSPYPIRASIVSPSSAEVVLRAGQAPLRINGTTIGPGEEHRILLNAGEQCLIETAASRDSTHAEGVVVRASQPVAVFFGSRTSDGMYFEQLLPAEYWGTDYVVPTFPEPAGGTRVSDDDAIVAAVGDSTRIRFGDDSVMVNAGECVRIQLSASTAFEASRPIMVLVFRRPGTENVAARCAMMVPPTSARMPAAQVISPQLRDGVFRVYSEQYIVLAADSSATSSVRVDGAPWSGQWASVRGSSDRIGYRRLGDDAHSLEATAGRLQSWTIGYGERRAYGMCGDFTVGLYPYMHARFQLSSGAISTHDTFSVAIVLDELVEPPALLGILPPAQLRLRVRWNATVAAPLRSDLRQSIYDGYCVQWLDTGPQAGKFRSGDTVALLRLVAALGELPSVTVEIDSVEFLDASGTRIVSSYTQSGGHYTFTDIWQDSWGVRLVSPEGGAFTVSVVPNPIQESAVVVLSIPRASDAPLVELYTAMGERVMAFHPSQAELADGRVTLVRGDLPSGMYFLRVASGERSLVVGVVFQ